MLRHLVFGVGFMSATMLSSVAFAAGQGGLQIIISKDSQSMAVYDGDQVIAETKVSTGKAGHRTPSGIFSILEKRKYHESNLYSNAPMPWMQRLTWSGIALHEGRVPNYPASHGCIRMPAEFAKSLFGMTETGAHVLVTDAPVVPVRVESANLFRPRKPLPDGPLMTDVELRASSIDISKTTEVAMNVVPHNPARHLDERPAKQPAVEAEQHDTPPLRILITRRGNREILRDAQVLLQELGFDTGGADGFLGPLTRSAIDGFKRWKNISQKGAPVTPEFLETLYATAGEPRPAAGQIMVRQNFEPLLEAAVGIEDPEIALGTHFFSADEVERRDETAVWTAVTLPNRLSDATRRRLGITVLEDASAPDAAIRALNRIAIPADIRDRIESMMSDGTSVTINDEGIGLETGKGTDFVTITRPPAPSAAAKPAVAKTKAKPWSSISKPRPIRQKRKPRRIGLY